MLAVLARRYARPIANDAITGKPITSPWTSAKASAVTRIACCLPERLEQPVAHAAEHELLDDRRHEDDDRRVRRELRCAARVEALRDQPLLLVGVAELRDDCGDDEDAEDDERRDAGGPPPGSRGAESQEPAPVETPRQGQDDAEEDRVLEAGGDARLPAERDVLRGPVAADARCVGDERHECDDGRPAGEAPVQVMIHRRRAGRLQRPLTRAHDGRIILTCRRATSRPNRRTRRCRRCGR